MGYDRALLAGVASATVCSGASGGERKSDQDEGPARADAGVGPVEPAVGSDDTHDRRRLSPGPWDLLVRI